MKRLKVILLTVGTDGDVIPYIGLGERLLERGHKVVLLANEHFAECANDRGFEFHPVVSNEEYQRWLSHSDLWHPLKSGIHAARWGARLLPDQYDLVERVALQENCLIVSNPGMLAGRLAHDKHGIPLATMVLQPWILPSIIAPPLMAGKFSLPGWTPTIFRRMIYWAIIWGGDLLISRELNGLRRRLGLPTQRHMLRWWHSPQLILGMFPDWYAKPPPDWPAQLRLVGFPMTESGAHHGTPSEPSDVSAKEIIVTFGTGMMHAAQMFRAVAEACALLGRRALFITKYPQQLPSPLPPGIRHLPFASFKNVFPRASAVVHHGGIGTVAKALAAGTPQLVLPFAYDQFDNGNRLRALGAGDFVRQHQATPARIAQAIEHLESSSVRSQCQALAAKFQDGNSALDRACEWIEKLGTSHPNNAAFSNISVPVYEKA